MTLSARNQLKAKIKNIKSDNISSEVVLNIGGQEMCATITSESAKKMGINVGDNVTAVIKASNVIVMN